MRYVFMVLGAVWASFALSACGKAELVTAVCQAGGGGFQREGLKYDYLQGGHIRLTDPASGDSVETMLQNCLIVNTAEKK